MTSISVSFDDQVWAILLHSIGVCVRIDDNASAAIKRAYEGLPAWTLTTRLLLSLLELLVVDLLYWRLRINDLLIK